MTSYDAGREIAEINMTPFVDIVLVVLVIFMATASFVASGKIPIKLPKATATDSRTENEKPLEITINREGGLFLDSRAVGIDVLSSQLLVSKQKTVLLRSDAKTAFESVVAVIDACKKAGIEKYSISTSPVEVLRAN